MDKSGSRKYWQTHCPQIGTRVLLHHTIQCQHRQIRGDVRSLPGRYKEVLPRNCQLRRWDRYHSSSECDWCSQQDDCVGTFQFVDCGPNLRCRASYRKADFGRVFYRNSSSRRITGRRIQLFNYALMGGGWWVISKAKSFA
jgi:hypothetical protein